MTTTISILYPPMVADLEVEDAAAAGIVKQLQDSLSMGGGVTVINTATEQITVNTKWVLQVRVTPRPGPRSSQELEAEMWEQQRKESRWFGPQGAAGG